MLERRSNRSTEGQSKIGYLPHFLPLLDLHTGKIGSDIFFLWIVITIGSLETVRNRILRSNAMGSQGVVDNPYTNAGLHHPPFGFFFSWASWLGFSCCWHLAIGLKRQTPLEYSTADARNSLFILSVSYHHDKSLVHLINFMSCAMKRGRKRVVEGTKKCTKTRRLSWEECVKPPDVIFRRPAALLVNVVV